MVVIVVVVVVWRGLPVYLQSARWLDNTHRSSNEVHHKQRMSLAAVKNDAMATRKRLLAKKQLLCTAAPAASAFGGSDS